MMGYMNKLLKLTTLSVAIAYVHTNALAFENLEKLDDYELADSTGEGLAILPTDFSMQMNGADIVNDGRGTYGAGYIRLIPVGPLTDTAIDKGYEKADGYIYGVSLGQSKKAYNTALASTDWGVPFGAIGTGANDFARTINTWGTSDNPWIFKAVTDNDVPDFNGDINNVTYMTLEAPLRHKNDKLPTSDAAAMSAYNLKLGTWMDFYQRDSDVAESGYDGLSNRLRLAITWDGFSINGSNLKIFQTLGGVEDDWGGQYTAPLKVNEVIINKTLNYGLSTSYNQTFGIAGLVRLNSLPTDTAERRGQISNQNIIRQIIRVDYDPFTGYNSTTNSRSGHFFENGVLAQRVNDGTFTDTEANITNSARNQPTMPAGTTTNWTTTDTGTPDPSVTTGVTSLGRLTETYVPMTNTSLRGFVVSSNPYLKSYPGSFYRSGICTSAENGENIREGNRQSGQCFYKEGFTTLRLKAFSNNTWTPPTTKSVIRISTQELLGGTFGTGTPALGGGSGVSNMPNFTPNTDAEGVFLYDANINIVLGSLYQPLILTSDGSNFSFELTRIPEKEEVYRRIYQRYEHIDPSTGANAVDPSVTYLGSTCNIYQCHNKAGAPTGDYQGANATHSSITIGSTVYDAATNQLTAYSGIEAYGVSIGELKAGNNLSGKGSSVQQDLTQVWRVERGFTRDCFFCDYYYTGYGTWVKTTPKAAISGQPHPSINRPDPYETTYRQNFNNQVLGIQTTVQESGANSIASKINAMSPAGATVANNFGSASIDGLLIQHFKFTTTGLGN